MHLRTVPVTTRADPLHLGDGMDATGDHAFPKMPAVPINTPALENTREVAPHHAEEGVPLPRMAPAPIRIEDLSVVDLSRDGSHVACKMDPLRGTLHAATELSLQTATTSAAVLRRNDDRPLLLPVPVPRRETTPRPAPAGGSATDRAMLGVASLRLPLPGSSLGHGALETTVLLPVDHLTPEPDAPRGAIPGPATEGPPRGGVKTPRARLPLRVDAMAHLAIHLEERPDLVQHLRQTAHLKNIDILEYEINQT